MTRVGIALADSSLGPLSEAEELVVAREAKRSKANVAANPEGECQRTVRVRSPVRRSKARWKDSTVPVSRENRSWLRKMVIGK